MNRFRVLCFLLPALLLAAPAHARDDLPWRLKTYPDGGQALTDIVATTLISQGDLILPTCDELRPGNTEQIASGFAGISVAVVESDPDNAAMIVDGLPLCWKLVEATDADTRITLGAALALTARRLAETNLDYAHEVDFLVEMSNDEVVQTSYEVAMGQDNLGLLIAQEDGDGINPTPGPPAPIGGGGIPSIN